MLSGLASLLAKRPQENLPDWVEKTGEMGGQAMTTLTNPITGETFTAGSTNYRVKPELTGTWLGGGLADGVNQPPTDAMGMGRPISELSYNDRQRELMKAAAGTDGSGYGGPGYRGPDPAMGGIMASLNGMGNAIEQVPGQMNVSKSEFSFPTGAGPLRPAPNNMIQEGFKGLGSQIKSMDETMQSGFERLIQDNQQQQNANSTFAPSMPMMQPMFGAPSFTAPNPFGASLFGGIAPYLMQRQGAQMQSPFGYAQGGEVQAYGAGGEVAKLLGRSAKNVLKSKQARENMNALKKEMNDLDYKIRDKSQMTPEGARERLKELEKQYEKHQKDFFDAIMQEQK